MDKRSAELCGREAVRAALSGETGKMIALLREPGECSSYTKLAPLRDVARRERRMPAEFLSESGNDVTARFLSYAKPLVGEVQPFPRLRE
jgi:6-phosphofructokinase 1